MLPCTAHGISVIMEGVNATAANSNDINRFATSAQGVERLHDHDILSA
jgi:hypothetical protein